MVKGVLVLLLAFNMLAAEEPSSPYVQGYTIENQYEGNDGTVYYKSQKVEVLQMGQPPEAHNEPQKNVQSDARPYAERKDFVNNEQSAEILNAPLDQRPYAERKDFVSLQEGQENPTIDWIVGKTSTDITFAVVDNKVVAYKTTTYLLALKPKAHEVTSSAIHAYDV